MNKNPPTSAPLPTLPLTLGSLTLPHRILYSPLAGCSNLPYREVSARYGAGGLHYCEMVKMEALVRREPETLKMLDFTPHQHPIGAQMVGSDPKLAPACAQIIEEMGFDTIDLNCGCPVDKITRDGSGSALLKRPQMIGEILASIVARVSLPVTVKIRAGWDENHIYAPLIAKIAQEAGAKAITIHGRTREQGYRGPANWDYIRECKEAAPDFIIIGNGDLLGPCDIEKMYQETYCDAFMVARGHMGRPWIAKEMLEYFQQGSSLSRGVFEALQAMEYHYEVAQELFKPSQAMIELRKISSWYLKEEAQLRSTFMHLTSDEEVKQLFKQLLKEPSQWRQGSGSLTTG